MTESLASIFNRVNRTMSKPADKTLFQWHRPGQVLTIGVGSYEPRGGLDFSNRKVPLIKGRVVVDSLTVDARGVERVLKFWDPVTLVLAQTQLRDDIPVLKPKPGDYLRIEYVSLVDAKTKEVDHSWKKFDIQIDRRPSDQWLDRTASNGPAVTPQIEKVSDRPDSPPPPPEPDWPDDLDYDE